MSRRHIAARISCPDRDETTTLTREEALRLEIRLNKMPQGNHGQWTGLGDFLYTVGTTLPVDQTTEVEIRDPLQFDFVCSRGTSFGSKQQKQVDNAIQRALQKKSSIGKCRISEDERVFTLHYQDRKLLVFNLNENRIDHYFYETDTDKRIFNATLEALCNMDE